MPLAGTNSDQARIDWVAKTLQSVPKGYRILDAGAGEMRLKPYCSHLDYVSQDFCQYEGSGDGKALQTGAWDTSRIDIVSNITAIPVPDASFDAVLCSEVFEHIPNPIAAIKEFARVLKPGGILVLTAPFCSLTHFAPYHFASGLNRYWYEEHLSAVGIKIEEITPNGNWFEFMGQELSRARMVSRTYSSALLGWLMLAASLPLRFVLRLLSNRDRGSSQLLCYGYMVKAQKILEVNTIDSGLRSAPYVTAVATGE
jgi:ubiquinone/menaquinone biosynthesis C-methylase UbiE